MRDLLGVNKNTVSMVDLLSRLGWTQKHFASQIGVNEKTVSRWCIGKENSVARAYLDLVARLLGV